MPSEFSGTGQTLLAKPKLNVGADVAAWHGLAASCLATVA